MTQLILILSTIYALKLIFDIIKRIIQSYKIIPEFKIWMRRDIKDIKSIITIYYLQNIFFILLSGWILFIILAKLNSFIEGIYFIIISLGVISSLVFLYCNPLTSFNLISKNNLNDKSLWIYLLLLLFILFYMLILPLIIINIINTDKFKIFKNDLINDYLEYCKSSSIKGHYMDAPQGGRDPQRGSHITMILFSELCTLLLII
jgi:hypothetical protein